MKTAKNFIITISLIATFSSAIAQAQNLILDGSFESPSEPTNGVYEGVTPLDWTGGARLIRGTGEHMEFPAPEQGNQYEGIQSTTLSQTFNVLNGGLYLLTWYDNSNDGSVYKNTVTLKNIGITLLDTTYTDTATPGWNEHTAEIALAPGSGMLEFEGSDTGLVHLIDNVSLVQIPDAADSGWLLLIACAGLAGFARKIPRSR